MSREDCEGGSARFEGLEARLLAAGDVMAVVVGGDLILTGDGAGNEIVIDQAGLGADEFRIRSGADATTVNGEGEVIVAGVTGDVRADLRRGDDVLAVVDAVVAGDLLVHGRRGDDAVTVTGCEVGGRIVIREGVGAGSVGLAGSEAGGSVLLFGGGGGVSVTVAQLRMGGGFSFRGGRGEDSLDVDEMEVGGSLRSKTGAGNDTVTLDEVLVNGTSLLCMGGGDDLLAFESERDGLAWLGAWRWWMPNSKFTGKVIARMGRGEDTLGISWDDDTYPEPYTDFVRMDGGARFFGGPGSDLMLRTHADFTSDSVHGFDRSRGLPLGVTGME